jgi:hypothetical protein
MIINMINNSTPILALNVPIPQAYSLFQTIIALHRIAETMRFSVSAVAVLLTVASGRMQVEVRDFNS